MSERDALIVQVDSVQDALAAAQSEAEQLRIQLESQANSSIGLLEPLKEQLKDTEDRLKDAQAAECEAREKLLRAEKKLGGSEVELAEATKEVAAVRASLCVANDQARQAAADAQHSKAQAAELHAKVNAMAAEVAQVRALLAEVSEQAEVQAATAFTRIAQEEARAQSAAALAIAHETSAAEARKSLTDTRLEIERLGNSLAEALERAEVAEVTAKDGIAAQKAAEEQLVQSKRALAAAEARAAAARAEAEGLQTAEIALREEVAALKEQSKLDFERIGRLSDELTALQVKQQVLDCDYRPNSHSGQEPCTWGKSVG